MERWTNTQQNTKREWIQREPGDRAAHKPRADRKGQTNGQRADRESTESERVKSKEKQRQETGEMGTQEGDADGGGGDQERNRFQSCCGGRREDIATAWLWGRKVREELVTMTA